MYKFILSVALVLALKPLKARLKGLTWLVLPIATIGVLRLIGRNKSSPPQTYPQSGLPYYTPPQNVHDNPRTSVPSKYSSATQAPSPYSHRRQPSTPYPIHTPLAPCDAPVAKSVKYTQLPRPSTALVPEVTYRPSYENDEYLSLGDDEFFLEDDETFALEHQCQCHMAKLSYESGEAVACDEDLFVEDLALNTTIPLGARPPSQVQLGSKRPAGRQRCRSRKVPKLDLHGYRVKEAISCSKKAIEDARQGGHSQIRFIVGKGLHSKGNIAKIKPALERWLKQHKLTSNVDPRNAGILIVQLA